MEELNDSIKKEPQQKLRKTREVVNKYVLEMTYSKTDEIMPTWHLKRST